MKWVNWAVGLGQWGWMVDDGGIDAPWTSTLEMLLRCSGLVTYG